MLALAFLVCAPTLELSAELRDELRFRERIAGDFGNGPFAFDIQTDPALGLQVQGRHATFTLQYNPRLLAREPYARSHTEILQRASASLDAQWGRYWRFLATEYFAYGDYDISSIDEVFNPVTGKIDTLPNTTTLLYMASYTQALIAVQASRHVGLSLLGSYLDGGGQTEEARLSVPIEKTGREAFAITGVVGREDALVTTFASTQTEFSSGQRYIGGEITELLQHRFSSVTELDLTAGADVLRDQAAPNTPFHWDVFPEGIAAVTHTISLGELGNVAAAVPKVTEGAQALELRADVNTGPYFNRTTGEVYARVGADLGFTYHFSKRWSAELKGGLVLSLKRPRQTQDVLGLWELTFKYRIAPYMVLEAGARQLVDTYVFAPGSAEQWLTFVAFTWGIKGKV